MAIEFHCDHCGHLVRTGIEHAGKRGRCPHCHQNVYIPTPSDQIEPLRLAPLDEEAERERQRKDEESRAVARALLKEKEAPPELVKTPLPEPVGDVRLPRDVETLIIQYILCMADGKLNEAQELAAEIRMDMDRAREYIQRLTVDELPPTRLAHIPRAVLLGFLKQLRK